MSQEQLCTETPRTDAACDFTAPEKLLRESRKLETELNQALAALALANAEVERLRGIIRTDPTRLHIRMSMGDFHIARDVLDIQLRDAREPIRLVEIHAGHMFYELNNEMKK